MRDYARIDTSEKPDLANKICQACGLAGGLTVVALIILVAAS
jgi:hypothetical protein